VITIDALRADVVVGPEHEALLPSITALKRESVMFTNARSTAPGTSASLAAFFTGKYFSELYWTPIPGNPLVCPHDDHSVRFPEILAGRGAATVTFASLSGMLNDTGIARGFTEETFIPGKGGWATARMVDELLIPRLSRQGPGPLFLYVHYDDAHAPYNSTGPQGTEYERYLREVATVDVEIGRIRGVLAERGLDQRAAFILSADHGEAFGEHGTHYHATTVYDELLHVPLLVHVPGVAPRVVTTPVSLIDLGPTVLDLMGAPTPAVFMGQSLTPYLRGEVPVLSRPIVAEASRGMRAMVFADGIKAIHNPRVGLHEVYDLKTDPGELHDITTARAALAIQRQDVLDAFIAAHELQRPGYVTPFVR
jgi:arylsulfatase A-like enzyme